MALNVKQEMWKLAKETQRAERKARRGVAVTIAERRKPVTCVCRHTPKHHTKTGHCRPGCNCNAGANRA